MLSLVYTVVQILHNFGAVAVVGSPGVAWWFARDNPAAQCRLAWLLVIGWAAQGASGAGFGMTSYFLKGQLPEISGVALIALVAKIACVTCGFAVGILYLNMASRWSVGTRLKVWQGMLGLAGKTLSAGCLFRGGFFGLGGTRRCTRGGLGGVVGAGSLYAFTSFWCRAGKTREGFLCF